MRDPRDHQEARRPDAPAGLYFSRQGHWLHDGDRLFHERLSDLLHRHVRRDDAGGLIVTTGRDAVPFVCEDCPLVVRELRFDDVGDASIRLSDGTVEGLAGPIVVGADDRWRVPVRDGTFWALLHRNSTQQLEALLDAGDGDGVVVGDDAGLALRLGSRRIRMVTGDADWRAPPTSPYVGGDP